MIGRMQKKNLLVADGTGKYIDVCNFCGKRDIILPTGTLVLCPKCLGQGDWRVRALHPRQAANIFNIPLKVGHIGVVEGYDQANYRGRFFMVWSGICSVCGRYFFGGGAMVEGWACFKCLWTKLGRRRDALRVEGVRLV